MNKKLHLRSKSDATGECIIRLLTSVSNLETEIVILLWPISEH